MKPKVSQPEEARSKSLVGGKPEKWSKAILTKILANRKQSDSSSLKTAPHQQTTLIPFPTITAQSYAVYDMRSGSLLLGRKENLKREIASLTKIMTFYTVLDIINNLKNQKIDPDKYEITVSRHAAQVTGTTAYLKEGDVFTVTQLFFAMMLPSGNDAAYCLAEHFGELVFFDKYYDAEFHPTPNSNFSQCYVGSWQFGDCIVKYFLKEMNNNASKLKMFSSNFDSPHGLMNKYNYSTAYDLCLLTQRCMQISRFRDIVRTRAFTAFPLNKLGSGEAPYHWDNTNKLLGHVEGFIGCKTGVTDSAGPCFSGAFEGSNERLCVIVLNSKTMDTRWVEVPAMVEWALKRKQLAKT